MRDHGGRDNKVVRNALLQGVLEENLRIAGRGEHEAAAVSRKPRRSRGLGRGLAMLWAALFVVLGGGAYHGAFLADSGALAWSAAGVGLSSGQGRQVRAESPGRMGASNPTASRAKAGPAERRLLASLGDEASQGGYGSLLAESGTAMADIFGLDVKTIVIDAGHGGNDPGAIGHSGLQEKKVTLDIALKLRDRLQKRSGYKILLTRDSDEWMALKDRVRFANKRDADLFISIHVNYVPVEPVSFVETYYFGPHESERTLKVAERENSGSGYSVAGFKQVAAKIGNTIKQQESKALAQSIQGSLFRNLRRYNDGLLNAGIKTAPFVVLLGVETPGVLAEVTCISNREEERRLRTESYRNRIASFMADGIVRYLSQKRYENKLTIGGTNNGTTAHTGEG